MIKYEIPTGERRYYVVFDKRRAKERRFIHFFTTPKWNHVFLLTEAGPDRTIMIKPMPWFLMIETYECSVDYAVSCFLPEVTMVLKKDVFYYEQKKPALRGLYSCVSAVKALLDIKGLFIFTPYQLYRKLCMLEVQESTDKSKNKKNRLTSRG